MRWNTVWPKPFAGSAVLADKRSRHFSLVEKPARRSAERACARSGGERRLVRLDEIPELFLLLAGERREVAGDKVEIAGANVCVGRHQHVGDEIRQTGTAQTFAQLFSGLPTASAMTAAIWSAVNDSLPVSV
jgi:hypothetical protein